MKSIINTKVGLQRGKPRIWFQGQKLSRAGINPGACYQRTVDKANRRIVLGFAPDGQYKVSRKKARNEAVPLIDMSFAEIAELYPTDCMVRILITGDKIIIAVHHSEENLAARAGRFEEIRCGRKPVIGAITPRSHAWLQDVALLLSGEIYFMVHDDPQKFEELCQSGSIPWSDQSIAIAAPVATVQPRREMAVDVLVASLELEASTKEVEPTVLYRTLDMLRRLNPGLIMLDTTSGAESSASMAVIESVLGSLKYDVIRHETKDTSDACRLRQTVIGVSKSLSALKSCYTRDSEELQPFWQQGMARIGIALGNGLVPKPV